MGHPLVRGSDRAKKSQALIRSERSEGRTVSGLPEHCGDYGHRGDSCGLGAQDARPQAYRLPAF
jgi:hypothetical protein